MNLPTIADTIQTNLDELSLENYVRSRLLKDPPNDIRNETVN